MTITITNGLTNIEPVLVLPYEFEYVQANLVHEVPGAPYPDVTIRPAGARTGTLQILFVGLADALAAAELHLTGEVLELTDTVNPLMDMQYVPIDTTRLVQQESINPWFLLVPFQEVEPA